jgi:hypothetical protein
MALNPTPGDPEANTYADLAYFKFYLAGRYPSPDWTAEALDDSLDSEFESRLVQAAQVLDLSFNWTGLAASQDQSMAWPRAGMLNRNGYLISSDVIPSEIKNAQCELVVLLRETPDLFSESQAARTGVKKVDADGTSVEFQAQKTDRSYLEFVSLKSSRDYAYLQVPLAVRLMLIPSWYSEVDLTVTDDTSTFLFEVL